MVQQANGQQMGVAYYERTIKQWVEELDLQLGEWYRVEGASFYKRISVYHTGAKYALKVEHGYGLVKRETKSNTTASLKYYTNEFKLAGDLQAITQDLNGRVDAISY
jgi:hypothetical protein